MHQVHVSTVSKHPTTSLRRGCRAQRQRQHTHHAHFDNMFGVKLLVLSWGMLGAAAAAAAVADLDLRRQVREMAAQLQAQERAMEVLNQKARPAACSAAATHALTPVWLSAAMRRPCGRAGLNAKVRFKSCCTVLAAQYVCMEAKNAAMEAEKQRSEAENARLAGLNERLHEEEARRRGAEDAAKRVRDEVHALTERLGLAEVAAKVRVWCLVLGPRCSEMELCVWWCCKEVLCMLKGPLVPENVFGAKKMARCRAADG